MARKKRRSILRSIITIVLSLCFVAVGTYYLIDFIVRPRPIFYPAFGIDIPQGYAIHGIDVSRYQQVIEWSEVSEMKVNNIKIGFAFIKATEGIGKVDAQFRRNWLQAKQNQVIKELTIILLPGKAGMRKQKIFLKLLSWRKGIYLRCLI